MGVNPQKELIAAGNLIEKDGKILLVQEKISEVFGKWNLPIGRKESGEDIISCAKREGEEETGFKLRPLYLIGKYPFYLLSEYKVISFIFKSEIVGGVLTVPDDMLNVKWFPFEKIEKLEEEKLLIAPYITEVIKDYRAGKKIFLDSIIDSD